MVCPLTSARRAAQCGSHPLQRGGWVTRDRDLDASDRRAVAVRALRDRNAELFRLYSGMNTSMGQICAGYADTELELLADFLRKTAGAGQTRPTNSPATTDC
jgi:hypothetical protein